MAVIQLTAPYDPGDLDTTDYYQAALSKVDIRYKQKTIYVVSTYGNTVSSEWVVGAVASRKDTIENIDQGTQHWDNIIAEVSAASGESYLAKLEEEILQWLVDQGYYAGTVQ